MINPSPSQPKNQAQLLFVIPVSRYKQVVTPMRGIKEYFLTSVTIPNTIADNQKMIREILGTARSIKLTLLAANEGMISTD